MAPSVRDAVRTQLARGILTITLDRPERGNAWNAAMTRGFFAAFGEAARCADVRAVILTGAGSTFCTGADPESLHAVADQGRVQPSANRPFWEPLRLGKPVIAAIHGPCFGIGLQQALYCDVRFASTEAKFSTSYTRRGLVAEFGTSWLLPRLIGTGRAMDMLISARLVRSQEALEMGLVNKLVTPERLLAEAESYAGDLVRLCAPSSMRAVKHQLYSDLMGDLFRAYARSSELVERAAKGDDFKEGVESWLEKRDPAFAALAHDQALIEY